MQPLGAKAIRGRTGRDGLTSSSQQRLRRRSRCTEFSLSISRSPNESLQEEAANEGPYKPCCSEAVPWQKCAKLAAGPEQ
jgi:hypothetical protein